MCRRGKERGRERIPSSFHTVSAEPNVGSWTEIMTWAEIWSQTLNQLSHPGTPILFYFTLLYFILLLLLLLLLFYFKVSSMPSMGLELMTMKSRVAYSSDWSSQAPYISRGFTQVLISTSLISQLSVRREENLVLWEHQMQRPEGKWDNDLRI